MPSVDLTKFDVRPIVRAELPQETIRRAEFRRAAQEHAECRYPRSPVFHIGPGLILVFAGLMWVASVIFAGWTIARVWGC